MNFVRNESLARHCSWHIGGTADYFFEPASEIELTAALAEAQMRGLPVYIIGGGSNLLCPDEGVRGLVLKFGSKFSRMEVTGKRIAVAAGCYVPCLARRAAHCGLSGIEHICGIPGTIGGLVVMNGGSMRQNIGDHVIEVQAIDPVSGGRIVFTRDECDFSYRQSIFQKKSYLITQVILELCSGNPADIRKQMLKILRDRQAKFPLRMPSCGSVFKNLPELFSQYGPPGKIVEDLGFKGRQCGGALVSPQHANFIVNAGNATATDILTLVREISEEFHIRTGMLLEVEFSRLEQVSL